jgi:hypothetical protein
MDAKQILGNRSNAFLSKPFDDLPLIWKKFCQKFEFLHFFKNLLKKFLNQFKLNQKGDMLHIFQKSGKKAHFTI